MKMRSVYTAITLLLTLSISSAAAQENSATKDGVYFQIYEKGVLFAEAHYTDKEQAAYMRENLKSNPASFIASQGDGSIKTFYSNGQIETYIVSENGRVTTGEKYDLEGKLIDDKLGVISQIKANDALAKATLRTLSTASESYATANMGNYPAEMPELTQAVPPYLNNDYCDKEISGFRYTCKMSKTEYKFTGTPVAAGETGSTTFTITTGGVLMP